MIDFEDIEDIKDIKDIEDLERIENSRNYFLYDDDWFFYDPREKKFRLTEMAPPKAVESYYKYYKNDEK